jgi:hypothetical protein
MLAGSSGGWPPLPDEVPFDLAAIVAIVLSIGAGVLAWLLVRHRATRRDAEVASRAGAGVIALGVVCLLLWLASPFALLIALPAAHAALVATRSTRPWQVIGLALVAAVPAVLLVWWASGRIDRGIPYSVWYLLETTVSGARGIIGPVLAAAILVAVWSLGSLVMSRVRRGLVAAGPYRPVPTEDDDRSRRSGAAAVTRAQPSASASPWAGAAPDGRPPPDLGRHSRVRRTRFPRGARR